MKTIYVVTSGDNDDYHISGIFDTQEQAQVLIDAFDVRSQMRIEKWPLNSFGKVKVGDKAYSLRIAEDGRIMDLEVASYDYFFQIEQQKKSPHFDRDMNLCCHCFAPTENDAIEIARAYCLQVLNELGGWPKKPKS